MKKELIMVKRLVEVSSKLTYCKVDCYVEPSISSVVFFIMLEDYHHIFKAPFGLLEVTTPEALADIIINEVLEWRNKYEA